MNSSKVKNDSEILAELRAPIKSLVDRLCPYKNEEERVRLRQLAWQAVDVLAKKENISQLKSDKDIQQIIKNIREVGASEEFINQSLFLAKHIYQRAKIEYPGLLERYLGK